MDRQKFWKLQKNGELSSFRQKLQKIVLINFVNRVEQISLKEQERLTGVAVEAVFDSVSVATTFREKLAEMGIIFCAFSEAVQEHPELIKEYLGNSSINL